MASREFPPTAREWLQAQLEFRLAGATQGLCCLGPEVEQAASAFSRMSLLHAGEQRFSSLNGYDRRIVWDPETNAYRALQRRGRNEDRQVLFAEMCRAWGLRGSFLCNWSDAPGWVYPEAPWHLEVPVLQYCRRRAQRGSVVLFPVDPDYSGVGSGNLPSNLGDPPFHEKSDGVVWRGRLSGTAATWLDTDQFWATSVMAPGRAPTTEREQEQVRGLARYRVCHGLQDRAWADAGLIVTPKEQAALDADGALASLIRPLVRPRMSVASQLTHKFILAIGGNDIASGLYWGLLSNSVVLMVEQEWETALEAGLTPWVHYAPVRPDADDIEAVYQRLLADPALCENLIHNAHQHMAPQCRAAWRHAADWFTLQAYQAAVAPAGPGLFKAGLSQASRFSD